MEVLSNLEPLTIALIVLVIAGVWAVIELALFLRRTRKGVADITDSLSETISELRPTVAKLDGIVDELGSSSKQIEPLLEKATTTVDLVNVNLVRTESVLADVNTATNTAAQISTSVTGAAGNAANAVAGVVNKVAGKVSGKASSKTLEGAATGDVARLEATAAPAVEQVKGDAGYFTYPGAAAAEAAAEAAAPAAEVVAEAAAPAAEQVAEAEAPAAEAAAEAAAPAAEAAAPAADTAALDDESQLFSDSIADAVARSYQATQTPENEE